MTASTGRAAAAQTLSDRVWERHVVHRARDEPDLLYIDLHLVHEVTSPQAFDGLRLAGRPVRRPDLTVATEDHNVPTLNTTSPSPIPPAASRSRRCAATLASSGSSCTRWATATRASSTSSVLSWASPSRA